MKKINLNNFQSEKGKYTVCLGNGTATVFTNKEKDAEVESARLFKVPVHELDYETEYKPDFKTAKLKAI